MANQHDDQSSKSLAAQQPGTEKSGRPKATVSLVRVLLVRIRFLFLFVATGAVFAYWGTLENYYDKWTRPEAAQSAGSSDTEYFCPMCPQIIRDAPATCPICMMPLSKRKTMMTVLEDATSDYALLPLASEKALRRVLWVFPVHTLQQFVEVLTLDRRPEPGYLVH